MAMESAETYTAFVDHRRIASGTREIVLPKLKAIHNKRRRVVFLIFDDETGKQTDFDLRGSVNEVLARECGKTAESGPGRPRLGVVAREVTLLPRHWAWLEMQTNGASAAIRRLIDNARKAETGAMREQRAIHAAGRFLSAMAGNFVNYEEASRALYRGEKERFGALIASWPRDVRTYALQLSEGATP